MTTPPNVLLIISDQHRHDWLKPSAQLPLRTPHLDDLRSRGVTFERATTPSPLCAPARACLATGLDYAHAPVPNNAHDMPAESTTYYGILRDTAGYFVAGVGKFDLHKATFDWNLDGSRLLDQWGISAGIDNEGKFDSLWSGREGPRGPYMAHLRNSGLDRQHVADLERRKFAPYADYTDSPLPEESYLDNWIAGNAHQMLSERPRDTPWHLVVNFAGPHDPMDVTERMRRSWEDVVFPPPHAGGDFAGNHQEVRRRYAAMIENIDRHIGSFLERLDAEGDLDNTVVIYTSDHGEMLGDHGMWGKSVPLDPSIRIPLVISGPVVEYPGTGSEALVSLEDVAATILDLAGASVPTSMTSMSLVPVLNGSHSDHRRFVVSGLDMEDDAITDGQTQHGRNRWNSLRSWRTITTEDEKLILSEDLDHPYLVEIATDPHEERNIAELRPDSVARLGDLLESTASRCLGT